MALTRSQLLAGDSSQGIVLSGQVQGVKQGIGVLILPDGTINFDSTTATGVMRLNNAGAYNAYVWPTLAGAPAAGTILQSDGGGGVNWTANYVPTTGPTGAANLPVGLNAQRPVAPVAGQIRYNSEQGVLEYYDSTNWVAVVAVGPTPGPSPTIGLGLAVSGTAIKVSIPIQFGPPAAGTLPAEAIDGSLYWDDNLGLLFIRYTDANNTSQWVQVNPSGGGSVTISGTVPIAVSGTSISLNIGLGNVENGGFLKASTPIRNGPPGAGTAQLEAVDGSLYWDNNQGLLFIRYTDVNGTSQWVQVTPVTPAPSGYSGSFLSQSGQTVTVVNGIITSVV